MLKKKGVFTVGALVAAMATAISFSTFHSISYAAGTSQPSAKATCQVSGIAVLSAAAEEVGTESVWTTILSNGVHTSEQKCLFVDASLECGLYTQTLVKSKAGQSDTSSATASIKVRVLVDGVEAYPGEVVFSSRTQQLTAKLQGLLTDADGNVCLSADPDTGAITIDESCLLPEEIELILDTMSANSFNFITDSLSSGYHHIEVQAKIDTGTAVQEGTAEAKATIGKGSVTVEEIRLIKDEDVVL